MAWPFRKEINPEGGRIIGLSLENGAPIFAPAGTHSLTYAPSGAGKTTRVAMPALFSFLARPPRQAR